MRLHSIDITGFRAFGGTHTFDLSADMLVVHGPNGSGKTSLLDAVLWAITGGVDRLGAQADVVSEYAEFGEARVDLALAGPNNERLRILRQQERRSATSTLTVYSGDEQHSGAIAEARLMELLWPEGATAEDPSRSLTRSFTRAVYLQQDHVRSFIQDTDEQGRFDIVGEIVGAGRVGELVRKLEGSRKAWTTATNQMSERQLSPLLQRRDRLTTAVNEARQRAVSDGDIDRQWNAWLAQTESLTERPAPADSARRNQLESTLAQLQDVNRAAEFKLARLRELEGLLAALPPVASVDSAAAEVAAANVRVNECEATLAKATDRAAGERQRLIEQSELRDSLATMARLALGHLEAACPVCQQPHNVQRTAEHLEALIAAATAPPLEPSSGDVDVAARALRAAEEDRGTAEAALRQARRDEQDRAAVVNQIGAVAAALELDAASDMRPAIARAMGESQERIARSVTLRQQGERLSSEMAQLEQGRRADELAAQLPGLEADIARQQAEIKLRELAGEDARKLHDAVRALSENLVNEELKSIEPLLQRIYASVDPHPTFRAVKFLTSRQRGRGQLWTTIADEARNKTVNDPTIVLSSSQLNVLAVTTFMAMNLSARILPLEVAALDDPLQSLDNVNLLGLADLLRRTRRERQIIISTHDDKLVGLLERKLRPVEPEQRTTIIHMDGWQPSGPVVAARELARDTGTPRLLRSVG